jgi:hypothetical protein
MKRRIVRIALGGLGAAMLASSCARHGRTPFAEATLTGRTEARKGFSAHDVISWAHLDDMLSHHLDEIAVGSADGKSILADLVMVLDGEEMLNFVKAHGYASFRGPVAVRKRATALEVDVELTGKDGETIVITLFSDGTAQGAG